ncbi:MAG: hypothetical protein ACR2PT_05190 [Endozoicomonas sp.]
MTDWFEVELDLSPGRRKEVLDSRARTDQKLARLAKQSEAASSSRKRKAKPGLSADQLRERNELNSATGYHLALCGLTGEARPYLQRARLDLTPQTDKRYAAALHYAWFTLHHVSGETAEAMESLRQCMDCDNLTASWEMMLVRMGLVEEYRTFCNPGQAWDTLVNISTSLSRNKAAGKLEEASLYSKQLPIAEIMAGIWSPFLPIAERSRNYPLALEKIRTYLATLSKKQSTESLKEAVETLEYLASFIASDMSMPLALLYQQHGPGILEEIAGQWQQMKQLSFEQLFLRKSASFRPFADWFMQKGMAQSDWNIIFEAMKDHEQFGALVTFMGMPREHQIDILELTRIAHAGGKEPVKPPLTCNLGRLLQLSARDHRANQLLTAMAQSASQVYWARDCLRHLVGIDLHRDPQAAAVNAECLKRISEASGAFLKGLCLLKQKAMTPFVEELELVASMHQHPPSLLALGDRFRHFRQGNQAQALKYYLQAGAAGAAAGYIKAAEMVVAKAPDQGSLWGVAAAYYQQAYQLLSRRGLAADEQHCVVMAEFCETMMENTVQTGLEAPPAETVAAATKRPDTIEPVAEKTVSKEQQQPELPAHQPKTKARPALPPAGGKMSEKATREASLAGGFWRQMKAANDSIRELDFTAAETALNQLEQKFGKSLYSARIDQTRAWCCKTMVDHMRLLQSQDSCQSLINQGWGHIASGIFKLTRKRVDRKTIGSATFDTSRMSSEEKKSLASLVSTAAHLSGMEASLHRSEQLTSRSRRLYQEADTINPGRLRQRVEAWQRAGSGVQVVDEATFELLKNAMKDMSISQDT